MAVIGDTPLLADVDGDRRKDLVVVSGSAPTPILVALSTGTAFSPPVQWSTILNDYRSFGVGDMNQDGREDLLGFVRGKNPHPAIATSVEVLFAESQEFSSPTTLLSTFAGEHDLPLVFRGAPARPSPPILDLVRIDPNGQVRWVAALASFPVPSGAPWERYRFFTEKGLGTAMFPEWLWTPTRCVRPAHRYLLLGASGSGDHLVTRLSVRPGSSEAHVLEELGHSIFRNCFPGVADEPHDPFGLTDDIYSIPISEGGFEADNSIGYDCIPSTTPGQLPVPKPGVPVWIDCRDPEHYFLAFMKAYRTSGELIRSSIDQVSDAARKARYQAQYSWLKNHWFNGVEFYRDPTVVDAQRETVGLACLPGRSLGPPFVEPVSGQPTSSRCPLRSPNLAGPTPVP
jgi:hypothetical protein